MVQVGPTGVFTGIGMQAQPNDNSGTRKTGYATRSPRLDYDINFARSGIHYVWVRAMAKPATMTLSMQV